MMYYDAVFCHGLGEFVLNNNKLAMYYSHSVVWEWELSYDSVTFLTWEFRGILESSCLRKYTIETIN